MPESPRTGSTQDMRPSMENPMNDKTEQTPPAEQDPARPEQAPPDDRHDDRPHPGKDDERPDHRFRDWALI